MLLGGRGNLATRKKQKLQQNYRNDFATRLEQKEFWLINELDQFLF